MKRIATYVAVGTTLITNAATPVAADQATDALRVLGAFIDQLDRGHRYGAPRYHDDDDDDGRRHRGHVRTYHDDDDDGGYWGARARAWNDDDD